MKEAFMPFEPRHLSTLKPPPADLKASDIPVVYAGPGTEIETVFPGAQSNARRRVDVRGCPARFSSLFQLLPQGGR